MPGEVAITEFKGDQAVADHIADLHLQVRFQQRADGENQFRTNIRESQTDLRDMNVYYIEPGGNFFIAREVTTDQVAGFIGVRRTACDTAQIKRMAVMPEFRRQGIGSRLAKRAVAWSIVSGIKRLSLSTGRKENARLLYKSVGFVIVGADEVHDDHLMELELSA